VVRVEGPGGEPTDAAPAWAISFVDLQFDDGHIERWLGSASVRDEDLVAYGDLVSWGAEVSEEHSMIGDLGMAFAAVDRDALHRAPVEVVIEWNSPLPDVP
jgi:hypothetical protein